MNNDVRARGAAPPRRELLRRELPQPMISANDIHRAKGAVLTSISYVLICDGERKHRPQSIRPGAKHMWRVRALRSNRLHCRLPATR